MDYTSVTKIEVSPLTHCLNEVVKIGTTKGFSHQNVIGHYTGESTVVTNEWGSKWEDMDISRRVVEGSYGLWMTKKTDLPRRDSIGVFREWSKCRDEFTVKESFWE